MISGASPLWPLIVRRQIASCGGFAEEDRFDPTDEDRSSLELAERLAARLSLDGSISTVSEQRPEGEVEIGRYLGGEEIFHVSAASLATPIGTPEDIARLTEERDERIRVGTEEIARLTHRPLVIPGGFVATEPQIVGVTPGFQVFRNGAPVEAGAPISVGDVLTSARLDVEEIERFSIAALGTAGGLPMPWIVVERDAAASERMIIGAPRPRPPGPVFVETMIEILRAASPETAEAMRASCAEGTALEDLADPASVPDPVGRALLLDAGPVLCQQLAALIRRAS